MDALSTTLIGRILEREGSAFTDAAADRGGPTKFGITLNTLRIARDDMTLTASDVEALPRSEAAAIYYKLFLEKPGIAQIPVPALRELLLDSAVQHGPDSALRDGRFYCIGWLQEAVGATPDRIMGPATIGAMQNAKKIDLFAEVYQRRLRFYAQIVVHDATQIKWLEGWLERMGRLLATCLHDGGLSP